MNELNSLILERLTLLCLRFVNFIFFSDRKSIKFLVYTEPLSTTNSNLFANLNRDVMHLWNTFYKYYCSKINYVVFFPHEYSFCSRFDKVVNKFRDKLFSIFKIRLCKECNFSFVKR